MYSKPLLEYIENNPKSKAFNFNLWTVLNTIANRLKIVDGFKDIPGETLTDKIIYYFTGDKLLERITAEEIKEFCDALLQPIALAKGKIGFELNEKLKSKETGTKLHK